jgi:hypothetical protein
VAPGRCYVRPATPTVNGLQGGTSATWRAQHPRCPTLARLWPAFLILFKGSDTAHRHGVTQMKLRIIEVEGFQAYRDPCRLGLDDLDLAVIVCDAVVFALFGQVRTGTLQEVISTGMRQAQVSVTFDLSGVLYRVDRKLPQRGKHEATLYQGSEDGTWIPLTEHTVSPTNTSIVSRLGITHEICMATVFAAQNDAGRFIGDYDSAERHRWMLSWLALALAERGAQPVLRRSAAAAGAGDCHLCLHVADEVVQVCAVGGGAYLFVTESGSVLGFADDPGVIDDLAAISSGHGRAGLGGPDDAITS